MKRAKMLFILAALMVTTRVTIATEELIITPDGYDALYNQVETIIWTPAPSVNDGNIWYSGDTSRLFFSDDEKATYGYVFEFWTDLSSAEDDTEFVFNLQRLGSKPRDFPPLKMALGQGNADPVSGLVCYAAEGHFLPKESQFKLSAQFTGPDNEDHKIPVSGMYLHVWKDEAISFTPESFSLKQEKKDQSVRMLTGGINQIALSKETSVHMRTPTDLTHDKNNTALAGLSVTEDGYLYSTKEGVYNFCVNLNAEIPYKANDPIQRLHLNVFESRNEKIAKDKAPPAGTQWDLHADAFIKSVYHLKTKPDMPEYSIPYEPIENHPIKLGANKWVKFVFTSDNSDVTLKSGTFQITPVN